MQLTLSLSFPPFPPQDRITPATESVHKDILKQDFGVEDEWPVVAEHYGQWIVEDKFVDGRPRWEDVGVMFVPDVKPYEYMKLRLLNGTHSALSYVSHLSGFQFVDDALNCENIRDFVECYMDEVCASVPEVPGVDVEGYKKDLLTRFSNPYVKDKVERLMMDGSQKLRNTMRDAINFLSVESEPALLTTYLGLAVAAFIRYVTGIDQEGEEIGEVLDPMAEELREPARMACRLVSLPPTPQNGCEAEVEVLEEGEGENEKEGGGEGGKVYDPRGVITIVFGPEVAENEAFVKTVSRALELICEKGMMYTLLHVN
jgi:mannitol-1-phosphate/altronate dehydrogenase